MTALGLEALSIFLSVLLAFVFTRWQDQRAKQELVANALERCRLEIAANKTLLEQALKHQTAVIEQRETWFGDKQRLTSEPPVALFVASLTTREAAEIPNLDRTAWETAKATGALAHMPYEQAALLPGS